LVWFCWFMRVCSLICAASPARAACAILWRRRHLLAQFVAAALSRITYCLPLFPFAFSPARLGGRYRTILFQFRFGWRFGWCPLVGSLVTRMRCGNRSSLPLRHFLPPRYLYVCAAGCPRKRRAATRTAPLYHGCGWQFFACPSVSLTGSTVTPRVAHAPYHLVCVGGPWWNGA
jgi:hypothetical protein